MTTSKASLVPEKTAASSPSELEGTIYGRDEMQLKVTK